MIPTIQDVIDISNEMLWITLQLAMPTLITALVVGVAISLVQTVTGVQEMTLTFVPKLMMVLLVLAMSLPWSIHRLSEYSEKLISTFSVHYEYQDPPVATAE